MSSPALWVAALGTAATSLAAVPREPWIHMAVTGLVGLALAILAMREHQRLIAADASASLVASSTAKHLGLAWAWGALSIIATYLLILDKPWSEWWQFFLGFAFAAGGSFAFVQMLGRDAAAGKVDDTLIKVGRFLVQAQLAGMVIGVISLFIDKKFPRAVEYADWAGCNICFFGAVTIAAISLDALRSPRERVMQG